LVLKHETVLVTGSSGLIGTAVCGVLQSCGAGVRRFDLVDHSGDVRDPVALGAAMQGCTGVIHLAGVSRVVWGERDPEACHRTNVFGTQNVVNATLEGLLRPWLIFGSSREVYGQSPVLPVTEAFPLQPQNHYARSKVTAERAVQRAVEDGLRASILRFSTVYGSARDHADRVIPAFCRAALRNMPLRVEGDGNSLDITHVSDVAACIEKVIRALTRGEGAPPVHLTSGQSTPLLELARLVVQLTGSRSEIVTVASRDFDVMNFVGDPSLAQASFGWRSQTPLRVGLRTLISELGEADAAVA